MGWRLKLGWLLVAASSAAMAQGFSFGVKGGVPITDALKVLDRSRYLSDRAPYVIGPAVELRLFGGLSAEADLFYRRVKYASTSQGAAAGSTRTSGQIWEVPVLAKYRAPGDLARPFLTAGLSYRRMARFRQRMFTAGSSSVETSADPPELSGRSTAGATVGGGLELSLPLIRISGELRYTRWGSSSIRSALGGLASQLNQADFLLGILF
ncbi:MAG TPA: outer membrane beta-barrel protein [Bryobacteraceae bacterium]|nr:outer membrane beta-barrel protein [Bryobacteraceae bacterium]